MDTLKNVSIESMLLMDGWRLFCSAKSTSETRHGGKSEHRTVNGTASILHRTTLNHLWSCTGGDADA